MIAGLTAAAVVVPKAMAYATIAGLPVQVGLYTAFVPMVIYALLGTSRPLSVSTTTTIAILTAAALGMVAPGGGPAALVDGRRDAVGDGGPGAGPGQRAAARLRGELHLRAGAHRVQVRHRPGDRRRPGAEAAGDPHREGRASSATCWRSCSTCRSRRSSRCCCRSASWRSSSASSASCRRRRRRCWPSLPPSRRPRCSACRLPVSRWSARCRAACRRSSCRSSICVRQLWPAAVGIALMSFTESIAAGRAFAEPQEPRPLPNRELLALGLANAGGGLFGAMPAGGGTSQTAVNRHAGARTQVAELVTAAGALATLLLLAPYIALMPKAALAAVVIVYSFDLIKPSEFVAIRGVRTAEFRWALDRLRRRRDARHAAGHRRRRHRLAAVAGAPGLQSARVRARPQARHDRVPGRVGRAPRRRAVAGTADAAHGGPPVLRQRGARRRPSSGRGSSRRGRACCCSTVAPSSTWSTRRSRCWPRSRRSSGVPDASCGSQD